MGQTKVLKVSVRWYLMSKWIQEWLWWYWCGIKGLKSLLQAVTVIVYLIFHAQYNQWHCIKNLRVHFDEFNIIFKYYCCIDYILTSFVII